MKKNIPLVAIIVALYVGWAQLDGSHGTPGLSVSGNEAIASAFRDQKSGVDVTGEGVVTKILADDNDGSRHQRFIVSLGFGPTLLIAHNIDLAPRLKSLEVGDTVAFRGEYEWNPKGGLVHWTHHDPRGQHQAGWLRHNGDTFQ